MDIYGGSYYSSYSHSGSKVKLYGVSFTSCSARLGGGMAVGYYSDAELHGVSFTSCIAESKGGGIYDGTGPSVLILSGVSFTDCTEIRDNNDDYSIIGGNDIYSENHNPICSPKSLCLLTSPGEYGGSCYGDAAIWASVTLFDNDCSPTCVGFGYCISSCSSDNWYVPVVIRYQ